MADKSQQAKVQPGYNQQVVETRFPKSLHRSPVQRSAVTEKQRLEHRAPPSLGRPGCVKPVNPVEQLPANQEGSADPSVSFPASDLLNVVPSSERGGQVEVVDLFQPSPVVERTRVVEVPRPAQHDPCTNRIPVAELQRIRNVVALNPGIQRNPQPDFSLRRSGIPGPFGSRYLQVKPN